MIKKQYPLDIQSYDFKISTPVQLRFNDLDGYGHANNSSMQAFFDLGRAAYLQEACGSDFYKSNKTFNSLFLIRAVSDNANIGTAHNTQ